MDSQEDFKHYRSLEEIIALMEVARNMIDNQVMTTQQRQVMKWLYEEVERLTILMQPETYLDRIIADVEINRDKK